MKKIMIVGKRKMHRLQTFSVKSSGGRQLTSANELHVENDVKTMGDFTFWLSPWLSHLAEPKTRLNWR